VSFINYAAREINCKLVYYGPGLCGKTTNLQQIYSRDLGTIRGFKTRFHLYTVPGQVFYDASRKLILKGADGVVFVADSQVERMEANIESLENLGENLVEQGHGLTTLPHIIQYNKRDLPNVVPVADLQSTLNEHNTPWFEASAAQGIGVFETLKGAAKLILTDLKNKMAR